MPFPGYLEGGAVELHHVIGDTRYAPDRTTVLGDTPHQILRVDAALGRVLDEQGVDLGELLVAQNVLLCKGHAEQRLATGGRVRDHADGAGRRNRSYRGVAQLRPARPREHAVRPGRECAAFLGQRLRRQARLVRDEARYQFSQQFRLLRRVVHPQLDEQVSQAHEAKAYLACAPDHLRDLRQRILAYIDNGVEEVYGSPGGVLEQFPVDVGNLGHVFTAHAREVTAAPCVVTRQLQHDLEFRPGVRLLPVHLLEVDAAQVACFIGKKRLLTAGVSRRDPAQGRRGVASLYRVEEHHAGLAVLPRMPDDEIKHIASASGSCDLVVPRVYQLVLGVVDDGLHELVGDAHRYVEVGQRGVVFLAGHKGFDVGMVDAENPDVRTSPFAALLDCLRCRVEHCHEGHRARGHPAGGPDYIALGPKGREVKSGASTGLMYECSSLDGIEYLRQGIFDGQHETCSVLRVLGTCVHPSG
ncbi:MAG: hypothetical protein BWY85_00983 [Firmicutes bacterium ADurb.Bin506]|nr:MAG: hypothetical protein BWY85_00983 [Firmicutes bacterium ADurb.Bin506]